MLPSDRKAVDLLWDQIFKTCRVYEGICVLGREHAERLGAKARLLNEGTILKPCITKHLEQI